MVPLKSRWVTPGFRMAICIPSGIIEVEKRAVQDSAVILRCQRIDIYQSHIYFTGGGAMLRGLDHRIAAQTHYNR